MNYVRIGAVLFSLVFSQCLGELSLEIALGVESGGQKYQEALTEADFEKKNILLNEALSIYLPYVKKDPSGKLLSNIGDIYYSFGRYGYAIGYYRKALLLLPGDRVIQHNLDVALKTASVENEQVYQPVLETIGYQWMAPNKRMGIAVGLVLITFVVFSLNVWLPFAGFAIPSRVGLVCIFLYVGPIILSIYLEEPTAVVLRASPLSSLPGTRENAIQIPLDAGQMVYVEECGDLSGVAQVRTSSGIRGTISRDDLIFVGEY